MNPRILFALALLFSSCGLLGITSSDNHYITDPDQREEVLSKLENTPQAKYQDSLIARIQAATVTIPPDLVATTLIILTYDTYMDYLHAHHNKLNPNDTVWLKKSYSRYEKNKTKFFKNPKYKVVYADQKTYETFDPITYRYVLKQTVRYDYDRETMSMSSDGTGVGYVMTVVNYLYDRQTGAVFREIEDYKAFEK
jgi:hypothetical protein